MVTQQRERTGINSRETEQEGVVKVSWKDKKLKQVGIVVLEGVR